MNIHQNLPHFRGIHAKSILKDSSFIVVGIFSAVFGFCHVNFLKTSQEI